MFSRCALILILVAPQFAGVGSLHAAIAGTEQACGERPAPAVTGCCGEGCQCTPESCPCARPAAPAEQVPSETPAPSPQAQRIDLIAVRAIRIVSLGDPVGHVRAAHTPAVSSMADRASFRATLGIWTT